jgi:hypothetical protein
MIFIPKIAFIFPIYQANTGIICKIGYKTRLF